MSEAEFAAAEAAVPAELRQAMVDAAERIARFHAAGMGKGYAVETAPGWSANACCVRSDG